MGQLSLFLTKSWEGDSRIRILWAKQFEKGLYFIARFHGRFYRASVNPSWTGEDEALWVIARHEPRRRQPWGP